MNARMELRVGKKYRLSKKIGGGSFGDIFHGGFRDSHATARVAASPGATREEVLRVHQQHARRDAVFHKHEEEGANVMRARPVVAWCGRSSCTLVPKGQRAEVACCRSCPLGATPGTALWAQCRAEERRGSRVRPVAEWRRRQSSGPAS